MAIELSILSGDFERIAVVRDFSSLQWTQKYYEPGQFALQVGRDLAHLLPDARYVCRADMDMLGVIDAPKIDNMFMMRGRFAESLLMRRAVNRRVTYTGSVEDVCRQLALEFCIENEDARRNIDRLRMGDYKGGLGPTVTIQPYGQNVYDAMRTLLTAHEMSCRLRYDFLSNGLFFEVYQGLDRTQDQRMNDWCVFSSDWYNIVSETFTRTLDTRNFAYVVNGDEDKNEDELIIEIEIDDGRPRAEVWVQDHTKLTEDMTEAEFESAIRQTGMGKLSEFNNADTGECVIDVNNAMQFAIGDRCTYINSGIGITFEQRITEIREIYERNTISTTVILGKDELTEGKKILRAVT